MERLLIPLLASSLIAGCSSQLEIRGRTEPGIISMRYYEERGDQAPILPAHIVLVDKYFEEPNGNQALDAEETGYLVLQLRNDGLGEGKVSVRLTPLGRMEHLQMKRHIDFGFISVQEEKMLRIPIQAGTDVAEGNREMRVEVIDEYSLSTVPFTFSFNTHSLEVPEFRVVVRDYDDGRFYAGNKTDGLIAAGELVKVTANVQNLGGNAEGVEIEVDVGDSPNFRYTRNLEENTDNRFFLGDLARGDHGDVEFYFFTTPVFSDSVVKIQLNITEDRNRFGVTEELAFDIGQSLRTEEVLAVKSVTMKSGSLSPVLSAIVDVEQVPQHSKTKLENGIAIIVGIEEYKYTFDAAYKNRDAAFFYRYCREVLGISEDRILLRTDSDATKAEFDYVFEPKDTPNQGWLKKRLRNSDEVAQTDLFVFLAGHGFPDLFTGSPYLIPYDVRPEQTTNGVSLTELYRTLGDFGTRSVTVFVESCFSGASGYERSGTAKLLALNMNPVSLKITQPLVASNTVVFTATSGDKPSSNRDDLKHGIFTYFVLKGLGGGADQDGDKAVTVEELFQYVHQAVPRKALEPPLDREQIPELLPLTERLGDRAKRVLVQY